MSFFVLWVKLKKSITASDCKVLLITHLNLQTLTLFTQISDVKISSIEELLYKYKRVLIKMYHILRALRKR